MKRDGSVKSFNDLKSSLQELKGGRRFMILVIGLCSRKTLKSCAEPAHNSTLYDMTETKHSWYTMSRASWWSSLERSHNNAHINYVLVLVAWRGTSLAYWWFCFVPLWSWFAAGYVTTEAPPTARYCPPTSPLLPVSTRHRASLISN